MRDVIGQKVRHKRFGRGTVTDLSRDRIVVAFEEERKDVYKRQMIIVLKARSANQRVIINSN